ncbi:MAG: hypothetical protein JNM56_01990, partial [Planctomycetia bacterium]|nr:hypothetical protein [Planctomycetia bacterium]
AGNLAVFSISGDDIIIDVAAGSLIDANSTDETYDSDARDALIELWNSQALLGTAAQARADAAVVAFQELGAAEYEHYWSLLAATGNVYSASYAFSFATAQRNALTASGLSSAEIDALEDAVTADYHRLDGIYGAGGSYDTVNDAEDGSDDFAPLVYDAGFVYDVTAAESTALTTGIVFTEDQLLWSLSATVVDRTSDTETLVENANITGRNVTITVAQSFGRDADGAERIAVPFGDVTRIVDDASDSIKVSLVSAESDDLAFFTWVDANGDGEIGDNELTAWADADGDGIVDASEFNIIELTKRQDVDVAASGTIRITAGLKVFLGSETDVNIAAITTADGSTRSDVRLKVEGDLLSAATGGGAAIIGQDLVLESADGSIGALTLPFRVDLSGALAARAEENVYLASTTGTLQLATLFAGGTAYLFGGAIADANDSAGVGETNIVADALVLDVTSFGTSADALEVELGDAGLSGMVVNDLFVGSTLDLSVAGLQSRAGDLTLTAVSDVLLGYVAAFAGTVSLKSTTGSILDANGAALNVPSPAVTFSAPLGTVGANGEDLEIDLTTVATTDGGLGEFVDVSAGPSGLFRRFYDNQPSGNATGTILADFDGDGALDVLEGSNLRLNDGSGSFVFQTSFGTDNLAVGDLDGDGDLDIVGGLNQPRLWLNQGGDQGGTEGHFELSSLSFDVTGAEFQFFAGRYALVDFNGDGRLDILAAD